MPRRDQSGDKSPHSKERLLLTCILNRNKLFSFLCQLDCAFISTDLGEAIKYSIFNELRVIKTRERATASLLRPSESAVFDCSFAVRKL
jgi:hypothetical protein